MCDALSYERTFFTFGMKLVEFRYTSFVNGCFDVLHRGHIKLLQYARAQGTKLIVGLDSDARVKELKGEARPVNPQEDRKFMLESLECVDAVYIFNSDEELENLVRIVGPYTMIVGEEYREKKVIGWHPEISLRFFPKVDGYSTTKIIKDTSPR